MEYRTLHKEELESWFDHCMYVFNEGKLDEEFRKRFVNHYVQDPTSSLENIFVAVQDGEIISTVRLFLREIRLMNKVVKMAGIGEVSTKPSYRNQGLADKLMKMAIKKMEHDDIVLSFLATGVPYFYEKKGWKSINLLSNLYVPQNIDILPYKMREINLARDIEVLNSLYLETNSKGFGGVCRDEDYWKKWIQVEKPEGYIFLVNEKPVGYVFVDEKDDYFVLKESGYKDDFKLDDVLSFLCLVYGYDKVLIPVIFNSNLTIHSIKNRTDWMARLNQPLELGAKKFSTTEEIIKEINTGSLPFYFWEVDGF